MEECEEILMFSTVKLNRSDIPTCNSFLPTLNFIEIFPESLSKTPIPKPKKNFWLNLRMYDVRVPKIKMFILNNHIFYQVLTFFFTVLHVI